MDEKFLLGNQQPDKLEQLATAHNNLAQKVAQSIGQITMAMDALEMVLTKEITDYAMKFRKEMFVVKLTTCMESRLMAHAMGDLVMYQRLGTALDQLKQEAKMNGLQSLYNKTIRRMERAAEANKSGEPRADFTAEELKNMDELKVAKVVDSPE